MKILILSESFYPHGSGGELATFLYSNLLKEKGHDLIVITHKFPGEPNLTNEKHLKIYRIPIFTSNQENKYSTLKRLDLLLANNFSQFMRWADVIYIPKYWYSAILLAKLYHKPVVVHSHGFLPICPLAIAYNVSKQEVCNHKAPFCSSCIYKYEKMSGRNLVTGFASSILNPIMGSYFSEIIKLSDAVITVSNSQRDLLVANIPILQNKVHTIYNPLPSLSFTTPTGKDFGYFGGPRLQKGFAVLCRALDHYIKKKSTKVKIHSTCFSTPNAIYTKQFYQKGLITYGRVDDSTYNKIYEKIRAVIVPSVWPEVYGYVAAEAFLRGRLVVASRIGGLAEVTADCPGAFMFEPGDYHELSEQFETVQNLTAERVYDLAAASRETILKKYNNEDIVRQLLFLFSKVSSG